MEKIHEITLFSPEYLDSETDFHLVGEYSTPLSPEDKEMLQLVVGFAKDANASPSQSGYHVKAAGLTENGRVVLGANQENSFSDAYAHGETSIMSQIRTLYGDIGVRAITFFNTATDPDQLAISPCGACRDVLNQGATPDLIIAEGNQSILKVARLGNFLKADFDKTPVVGVSPYSAAEATLAIDMALDSYLPEELRKNVYGVALVGQNSNIWRGSLYTNAGYDSIPPGLAAVQTWRNTVGEDSHHESGDLNKIVIAGYDDLPDVLYRDRQALLELDEIVRLYTGRHDHLEVELVQVDQGSKEIVKAARTNTQEWMPYPFSAETFGMKDVIEREFGKVSLRDVVKNTIFKYTGQEGHDH